MLPILPDILMTSGRNFSSPGLKCETHHLRILKIIHGYGSGGKGGATKDVVRNWIFRNANKFKHTIDGENYNLYNASTQEMRKHVTAYTDSDLGSGNAGITIVWVK